MKTTIELNAEEAFGLRKRSELTKEESAYLETCILSGNPWPSHERMLHAWTAGAWRLLESLARHHIRCQPKAARAYINLAVALGRQRRTEEADKALSDAYLNCGELADVEYETSLMLAMDGHLPEAKHHYSNYLFLTELKNRGKAIHPVHVEAVFQLFLRDNRLPIREKFHQADLNRN